MAGFGGKRQGAGRKPGSVNKSKDEIKELLDKHVNFGEIIGKLVELANGVKVQRMTADGIQIYDEKPDSTAAKILLEYRYGKPIQQVAHSGEITEVIITKHIVPKRG